MAYGLDIPVVLPQAAYSDKEVKISTSTPLADTQSITVPQGESLTITVRYPQDGYIAYTPGTNNALDMSRDNAARVEYRITDAHGNVIWKHEFQSIFRNGSLYIYIDAAEEEVSLLTPGVYTFQILLTKLNVWLTDTTPADIGTIVVQDTDDTEYTASPVVISTPKVLQEEDFTVEQGSSGNIEMRFSGYADFVCDPTHEASAKICKLQDQRTEGENYLKMHYGLVKTVSGNETEVYGRDFRSEVIDDYTLRVYFTDEGQNAIVESVQLDAGYYTLRLSIAEEDVELDCLVQREVVTDETVNEEQFIEDAFDSSNIHNNTNTATNNIRSAIESNFALDIAEFNQFFKKQHMPIVTGEIGNVLLTSPYMQVSVKSDDINNPEPVPDSITASVEDNDGNAKFTFYIIELNDDDSERGVVFSVSKDPVIERVDNYTMRVSADFSSGIEVPSGTTSASGRYKIGIIAEAGIVITRNQNLSQTATKTFERTAEMFFEIPRTSTSLVDQYSFQEVLPAYNASMLIDPRQAVFNIIAQQTPASYQLLGSKSSQQLAIRNILSPITIPTVQEGEPVAVTSYVGVYVFGSYDGRQWVLLGGNEKTGRFTDIGCQVERTDVRFLRFAIAGDVKGCTRIDYMEMGSEPSKLNTKIR